MQAMIFSAGLGTRFKPWTDHHPKALALVNGKPLLQRNIEYLQGFGIKDIIVNVHHFPDQIINELEKNNGWGSNVIISDERDHLLDTGGGLLKAAPLLKKERFITCNVDILTDLNIDHLLAFHEINTPLISFAVSERKTSRYLLFDQQNRLQGWRNTNTGEEKGPVINFNSEAKQGLMEKAYSCVVVFEPEIFQHIRLSGKFSLIDLYLDLAQSQQILGFDHSGDRWVDVGRPESVATAELLFP